MQLIITIIILTSNLIFAQGLPRFEGQYTFSSQKLNLVQARHQLLIRVQSEVSKKYMAQLKSTGYTCQSVSGATYNCKKINSQILENSVVRQAVINRYVGSWINFDYTNSDYVLTNDAPSLKEYQLYQTSQMGQMKFDQTTLLILKNIVKIKLTKMNSSDVAYFNLTNSGMLSSITQVSQNVIPSENFISQETYIYLYELVYL